MDDMTILTQLIKESATLPIQDRNGKKCVTLIEPKEPTSDVLICNLPNDTMVIKADKFTSPDKIFNCNKEECKRADFIIISEEKKCILYIELKLTKDTWGDIVKQLMGAQCFVTYCQAIGESFWKEKEFLKNYKRRFIAFDHIKIDKKKTRFKKSKEIHDTPMKAMKISYPKKNGTNFSELACLGVTN